MRGRLRDRLVATAWSLASVASGLKRPGREQVERAIRQQDWPASTQRLGLRFTERLRDLLRSRWIRIHRN